MTDWDAFYHAAQRSLDERGPEFPAATVALMDALRDYIRCNEQVARGLLEDGTITREEFRKILPEMAVCKSLLRALQGYEVSCEQLDQLLHQRQRKRK